MLNVMADTTRPDRTTVTRPPVDYVEVLDGALDGCVLG